MSEDLLQPVIDPIVERDCLQFLKCCVGEWGGPYVTVNMPLAWAERGETIPHVHNRFVTDKEINISVQYGSASLSRTFPLNRV